MAVYGERFAGKGVSDPYIRGRQLAAVEPRRVVVELSAGEYEALEAATRGHWLTAPEPRSAGRATAGAGALARAGWVHRSSDLGWDQTARA